MSVFHLGKGNEDVPICINISKYSYSNTGKLDFNLCLLRDKYQTIISNNRNFETKIIQCISNCQNGNNGNDLTENEDTN